jgi:AcrR family transcriptional regulator
MDHNVGRSTPSTAPDARVVRTRETLRRALFALLEQKPFDQITIREITARAGTGYATFFRHYSEPRALLNDLVSDEISDLLALALPVLRSTDTRGASTTLCRYVDQHRQLWAGLLAGSSAGTMREEFIRQAKLVPRIGRKTTSRWLPYDLRIVFGVSAMFEVLAWWLQRRTEFKVEQVAEILDRLIVAPMMTEE